MKPILTFKAFSKNAALVTALIGSAVFFNSCKNDIDNTSPGIAALSIINAYPSTNTLDFYIGGQRLNNTGFAFGGKIDYFTAYEGTHTSKVTLNNSATTLANKSIPLKAGVYHSLYLVGAAADSVQYLLLDDQISQPAAGKAHVRFINLSPNTTDLSLELTGDTTGFKNKAFKGFTNFKPVTAAKSSFVLRNAANGVVATRDTVNLQNGKIYTIYAKGLATGGTDATKLSIAVSLHQ
ncbi:hypothetical protein IWX76_000501 [Pedobacter sp. CAN_A7]|uniref:DUF4397 domain-containing protein n=1 Tax=Pedobacter sp. CAN_A7 TaxID=2787722 RepID=UPI0018C9D8FA